MANQEHLDILQQGVKAWNVWFEQQQHRIKPDFRDADLSGLDLRGVAFYFADLSNANLSNAKLAGAEFDGTNLYNANLKGATLYATDLYDVNFSKANLSYAGLTNAQCTGGCFDDANLTKADLGNVQFYGSTFKNANLEHANLVHASFRHVVLDNANFSYATLDETGFENIDLRTVKGLETVEHEGSSTVGTDTLERSQGDIPEVFLRGVGLSDTFIEYVRALVQRPIDYYTCFISYSSKDEVFAKQLHSDLQSKGVRCWFAPEDMDTGDKIKHRIDESIKRYDKLLLILSKHSIASTWVAYEVERALNKEPAGMQNVLYPVRLDKVILTCNKDWAKDIKDTRHITNFEGWKINYDAYQDSFKRLLRALQSKDVTNKPGR